jgi:acyl-CoA thioester hydrolase
MSTFTHRLQVRFRDCDALGHANHAVYLTYMEEARFAMLRQLTGATRPVDFGIILARVECDYRAPARFGEHVDVQVRVGEIGRSSFSLRYELARAGTEERIAEGMTVLVTYDYSTERSVPIPEPYRTVLESARR